MRARLVARLSEPARQVLLSKIVLFHQVRKPGSLFERAKIFALQVFDDCKLQRLAIVARPYNRWDCETL